MSWSSEVLTTCYHVVNVWYTWYIWYIWYTRYTWYTWSSEVLTTCYHVVHTWYLETPYRAARGTGMKIEKEKFVALSEKDQNLQLLRVSQAQH